jgi:excinuclease UvrABC nuclease subunit
MTSSLNSPGRAFFVYRLLDAAGEVLYVGKTFDVVQRLRQHHKDVRNPTTPLRRAKAEWFFTVRSVDISGPYTNRGALAVERIDIAALNPRGNFRPERVA